MALEVTYPHIEKPPDEPARLTRMPRVRVAQIVMDYLAHGWSVEEMCRQHPLLTPAEAHAAMLYYWDHQDEIDREIRAEWDAAEQAERATPPYPPIYHRSITSAGGGCPHGDRGRLSRATG